MKLKVIKTKKEYLACLNSVDELFDKHVTRNSVEGEELQVALLLIKQYEDEHYRIPLPNPIDAIRSKMEERGMKNQDLVGIIGTKGYVSALLNKRKPLNLELAKIFHRELGIPAEILLS